MKKASLYLQQKGEWWEVWNTEADDGWYSARKCLGKFLTAYHAKLFMEAWAEAEKVVIADQIRRSRNEWSEKKIYELLGGKRKGLSFLSHEAFDAFCDPRKNYDRPLCLLDLAFREAGLKIEFSGGYLQDDDGSDYRAVVIYRGGRIDEVSIEGLHPAEAIKKIAEAVCV